MASRLVITPNRPYKLKVVQGYAVTSSQDDQLVERFYEDVESAMAKVKTKYIIVIGDSNAKLGKTRQLGTMVLFVEITERLISRIRREDSFTHHEYLFLQTGESEMDVEEPEWTA